jgi:hypothetical protein
LRGCCGHDIITVKLIRAVSMLNVLEGNEQLTTSLSCLMPAAYCSLSHSFRKYKSLTLGSRTCIGKLAKSRNEDNRLEYIPRQMKYAGEVFSTRPYHLRRFLVPSSSASFKLEYSEVLAIVSQRLIKNSKVGIMRQTVGARSLENVCCASDGSLRASRIYLRRSQSLEVK